MNGFLLNMINRHQGMVDKVQPRVRSMFEPETTPAVAGDNAFAGAADTMVKESRDTGLESRSAISKSPIIKKPYPETQPSARLRQAAQTSGPYTMERNHMDVMNEQIQGLLARLGKRPESQEPFNDASGLQKSVPSDTTAQTTRKVVSNEMDLVSAIEETLGRLQKHTSHAVEGKYGLQDLAHKMFANTVNTETDSSLTLPAHIESTSELSAEPLNQAIDHQAQTVAIQKNSPDGVLQIPGWLMELHTNLNNRWREINARSQAEPVINVTIGRVEVRAMNTEPVKPPAAQSKPKGVLSLEEYLKQRESKGRT